MTKQPIGFRMRRAAWLAVLLASWAAPAALAAPLSLTLKFTWRPTVQFLGFYVAQARGYYAEEGLAVTFESLRDMAEVPGIPERVAAGKFDFATAGRMLILTQAQGVAVTSIAAIFQFGPHAFFARADSGIVTPADLAGRRIVVKNRSWRELLRRLLQHGGLTLADVKEVPGGFDMTPFIEGDVEVWSGFLSNEIVRARQHGLDLVTLPVYEYGIRTTALTIYASRKALETDFTRAVRFLRASLRGWAWSLNHRAAAVDTMLALFPAMAAERDFHLASFDASIPLIIPGGTRLGTMNCQAWLTEDALAGLASTEGLCTTKILEVARAGK